MNGKTAKLIRRVGRGDHRWIKALKARWRGAGRTGRPALRRWLRNLDRDPAAWTEARRDLMHRRQVQRILSAERAERRRRRS